MFSFIRSACCIQSEKLPRSCWETLTKSSHDRCLVCFCLSSVLPFSWSFSFSSLRSGHQLHSLHLCPLFLSCTLISLPTAFNLPVSFTPRQILHHYSHVFPPAALVLLLCNVQFVCFLLFLRCFWFSSWVFMVFQRGCEFYVTSWLQLRVCTWVLLPRIHSEPWHRWVEPRLQLHLTI